MNVWAFEVHIFPEYPIYAPAIDPIINIIKTNSGFSRHQQPKTTVHGLVLLMR